MLFCQNTTCSQNNLSAFPSLRAALADLSLLCTWGAYVAPRPKMPADLMESSLTSASTIAGDERTPERHPRKYPVSAQEVSLLWALNVLSIPSAQSGLSMIDWQSLFQCLNSSGAQKVSRFRRKRREMMGWRVTFGKRAGWAEHLHWVSPNKCYTDGWPLQI